MIANFINDVMDCFEMTDDGKAYKTTSMQLKDGRKTNEDVPFAGGVCSAVV